MKGYRFIFVIIVLLSLTGRHLIDKIGQNEVNEAAYLQEVAPEVIFYEKSGIPPFYQSNSDIIAFNSYDIRPDIKGYGGPIKVLIAIDSKGIIRGIKLLEHKETRNYVHYMETPSYLSQFVGKSVSEPFEIDKDIDAISRATVSVEALARTIRETSREMALRVFNIEVSPEDTQRKDYGWLIYAVFFTGSLLLYWLTRRNRALMVSRDIFLVMTIVITGIYLSTPFSILHVFNLILGRISSSTLFYAVLIGMAFSLLISGRSYCGWLCPLGAISEFIGKIPLRKWSLPQDTDRKWRNLKYLLLFVVTLIGLLTGVPEFSSYEPYIPLFSFHGNVVEWAFIGLVLFANLKIQRFFCRYLCPVGAFTGILSFKAKGYRSSPDCPVDNPPDPEISECIRCNKCFRKGK